MGEKLFSIEFRCRMVRGVRVRVPSVVPIGGIWECVWGFFRGASILWDSFVLRHHRKWLTLVLDQVIQSQGLMMRMRMSRGLEYKKTSRGIFR